jgi:carbamoyltransferase
VGPRRVRGQTLDHRFTDIAACGHGCLAGGVALNCKMNMEIAAESAVCRLYVPPVPHDAGVALGAATLKMRRIES